MIEKQNCAFYNIFPLSTQSILTDILPIFDNMLSPSCLG